MKFELVKFELEHAYEILDNRVKEGLLLSELGDWEREVKQWWVSGPGYTLLVDDLPVACGGITLLDPAYGECWLMVPWENNHVPIFRHVIRMIKKLTDQYRFRRLQAHVREDFEDGYKLMERLGFVKEGRLEKYFPDGTAAFLFARTF